MVDISKISQQAKNDMGMDLTEREILRAVVRGGRDTAKFNTDAQNIRDRLVASKLNHIKAAESSYDKEIAVMEKAEAEPISED